jgi:hypothetical protein
MAMMMTRLLGRIRFKACMAVSPPSPCSYGNKKHAWIGAIQARFASSFWLQVAAGDQVLRGVIAGPAGC